MQVRPDGAAQPPGQQQQQGRLRNEREQQHPPQQVAAAVGGLRHDHLVRQGTVAVDTHRAQRFALVVGVAELEFFLGQLVRHRGRRAQPGMAANQAAVGTPHREIHRLALVKQQGLELALREPELHAWRAGLHIGRECVGVVQQGAVKRLLRVVVGDADCDGGAHQPHQGQRQQHVARQPCAQRWQQRCCGVWQRCAQVSPRGLASSA